MKFARPRPLIGKRTLAICASLIAHFVVVAILWNSRAASVAVTQAPVIIAVEMVPEPAPKLRAEEPGAEAAGDVSDQLSPSPETVTEESSSAPVVAAAKAVDVPVVRRPPVIKVPEQTITVAPVPSLRLLADWEMAGAIVAGRGSGTGSADGAGGGAGSGGSGAGGTGSGAGGDCDMAGRLQALVRRDGVIQRTAREAQSGLNAGRRAMVVWDGDWVMNGGQEGRGLAGLRQAIAVEVAFAPAACRNESVRGMVVLSLGDDSASPRIALGTTSWRWSQLALR